MTHDRPIRREKPAVPATPRDVVHIRLGSFALFFSVLIGALGLIAGIPVLTGVMAVIAVIAIVDIAIAIRRQSAREKEEDGYAGLE
ncbi:hypothetical protein [Thermostaphylospora chromogena]|uniref:Uncharacterized protein n=1 Tax=Thermostaphylospora chromogena TaxID=35622 RepID=A0A1H1A3T4_9ACTN|nr:hypothetical protein [Thermostaphylospora chromogena]SDQ34343.1 hypothetical protein SAMN04489764_0304 [Thermostaphylospora chromogena]